MCGIVSIAYEHDNPELGREATALLRRLEYRGYDSTGAAFIDLNRSIRLSKKVGAPSKVCKELGIDAEGGQRFIGQVRWATYGAVTDVNSQPHRVECKRLLVGAHNGNISNTDALKRTLTEAGHKVASDNDGEIVVHLAEEAYSALLASGAAAPRLAAAFQSAGIGAAPASGVLLLVEALRQADALAEGSYAAAVADPELPGVVAIKSGSSLYAGLGTDDRGEFVVVSSDLSSVLSKTRSLIPLVEGQGIWFNQRDYFVFQLEGDPRYAKPNPKRSKLGLADAALDPRYSWFMEQEIAGTPVNLDRVLRYYLRDSKSAALEAEFERERKACEECTEACAALSGLRGDTELAAGLAELFGGASWQRISALGRGAGAPAGQFISEEKELLSELARIAPDRPGELSLLDGAFVWRKRSETRTAMSNLHAAMRDTQKAGGRTFLVASGTSYHAALTAAYFFDGLAGTSVLPCNPGMFRSMYLSSLGPGDLLLGITQSGETKDLVDVFQEAAARAPGIRRACLVNNENSRIPQELSDFYLPILCGPEIAVAATKSFTNQLAILYLAAATMGGDDSAAEAGLRKARQLVAETIDGCAADIDAAARRLFARPSMHVLGTGLIGLAKEGALKVREVVLNHSEGYDAAEFKHGPNTILGKNTVMGLDDIIAALDVYRTLIAKDHELAKLGAAEVVRREPGLVESLFRGYPLVFVCPPDERDERITVSQIHTHKIRGADIVLFAERRADLTMAVEGKPAGIDGYWSQYIELPASKDRNLFVFPAAVALQLLALRMSVLKKEWLDELCVRDHGVHPDVPKNVSKSITVD